MTGTNHTLPTSRSRSRTLVGTLAVSALAIFAWVGSQRLSTGPLIGTSLAGSTPIARLQTAQTVRLGTFNIHGGRGTDGRLDLARIAASIQAADLVGLNEVRNDFPLGDSDQAAWLGDALAMRWLYAPAEQRWLKQRFGNGVLSRRTVDLWQQMPLLRVSGKSFRNVILLTLPSDARPLQVLVTHLDRSSWKDRDLQLQSVAQWFRALAPPAVLLGDLNASREHLTIQELLAEPGVIDALARCENDSPQRIDWILVRGLDVLRAGSVDRGASDHPYYWADVQIKAP